MTPSFSLEDFLHLLSDYNTSTWLPQVLLLVLAVVAVGKASRAGGSFMAVGVVLATLWLWVGVVFHLLFFRRIAEKAWLFSALSIVQAGIFLYEGAVARRLRFRTTRLAETLVGAVLIAYALVLYPVAGWFLGHIYPESQTLGAPCPATTFTLGILIWLRTRPRWWVLAIPVFWSLAASTAAIRSGVYEDIGLLLAGLATVVLLARKRSAEASAV